MASNSRTDALETWFLSHSGYLHESIRILHDDTLGLHFRAVTPIEPGTTIASAPHSITLSYLNALVDEAFPVFNQQRHKFKVEAIGFFYLMTQYVDRENSFWKPYLDTLPAPEDDFTQPLFFEDAEDVAWLEGTNVWNTIAARKQIYEEYYEGGIAVLREAGVDVEPYTWQLFLWSTMIFASRSFTSLVLLSTGSKYRTAFTSGPNGVRQAVLLDVSRFPAEDLDFPVLFPGLDAANHSHDARVHWTFDPGRFIMSLHDSVEAGLEVLNNYGPKGNGELLIGYGFCIPDNPHDTVPLTLKALPVDLQGELKIVHPEYFTARGEWNSEKAMFHLKVTQAILHDPRHIFYELPESLLELLLYILRHERNLTFMLVPQPFEYLTSANSLGGRYLPQIARMIVQFLSQTLSKLQSVSLPSTPQNKKQTQASIYRHGQVNIIQSLISGLRTYTRSLIWMPSAQPPELPTTPSLMRLEHIVQALISKGTLDSAFLQGIEASANTTDIEQLRLAGWEEDIWVLLLCYLFLHPERHGKWLADMAPEYLDILRYGDIQSPSGPLSAEEVTQANDLLQIVFTAASALPGSLWNDARWSSEYIATIGGRVLKHESFTVICPTEEGGEEARLCLYVHSRP